MAINPMQLMKLGERYKIFSEQHPRVEYFVRDQLMNSLEEGTVLEMRVTRPDGRTAVCNLRVTKEDLDTVAILRQMKGDH